MADFIIIIPRDLHSMFEQKYNKKIDKDDKEN